MVSDDRDPDDVSAEPGPAGVARIPAGPLRDAVDAAVVALARSDAGSVDDAIDAALAALGSTLAADRAYLFAYDFEAGICHNTHEWCAASIEPQIALLQAFPLQLVPEWVARHRAGEPMDVADVFALPPDSGVRQTLEPQGIKSLTTVPLLDGPACLGFTGFDAVRRQRAFGALEHAVLWTLADALVGAYRRIGRWARLTAAASAAHDAAR